MSATHACGLSANATVSGDPTNTRQLRQAFMSELRRRLRRIRGLVRTTVGYENDALQLKQDADAGFTVNAEAEDAFEFTTDSGRVRAFYRWLKQALREDVLEPAGDLEVQRGEHWTADFIERAYLAGWNQATGLLFQRGVSVVNDPDERILDAPIAESQLRQLYTRTFENLKDITESAANTLRRELTEGLAKGENPRKIARRLTNELESITRTRADVLARTEIINSHSTATLDRYQNAGVEVVSHGEWNTADDDRVCPICEALEGREFTIDEMRNATFELPGVSFTIRLRPPAHPNGRCVITPVIGAEPPETPLQERLPDETGEA